MKLIWYTGYLYIFPPLIAGIVRYRYLNAGLKWIFWFVVFATILQLTSRVMVKIGYYNVPLMHLYVPVKFLFYSMAYKYILAGFIPMKIIYGIAAVFISFSLVNSFLIQSITQYNSYVRAIGSLLIIVYAILYFMKALRELNIPKLRNEPLIWFNAAALVNFSGNFFVFMLSNLLLSHSTQLSTISWRVNSIIGSAFYIVVAIAFWKTKKNSEQKVLLGA
jgi:hypothetical protein